MREKKRNEPSAISIAVIGMIQRTIPAQTLKEIPEWRA